MNAFKKFLESILLDLRNAGVLNSKRKGGGYYLIKHPSEVNLAEIIRYFDGAIGLLPCVTLNTTKNAKNVKMKLLAASVMHFDHTKQKQ